MKPLLCAAALALAACGGSDEPDVTVEGVDPATSDGQLAPEPEQAPGGELAPESDVAPAPELEPDATLQPDTTGAP